MLILLVVVVVAGILFGVGAFIAGRLDGGVRWPPDAIPFPLPEGRLDSGDVARARFGIAFRGYRMADVDAALWRIAGELAARDAELGLLRGEQATPERAEPAPEPGSGGRRSPVRLSKAGPAPEGGTSAPRTSGPPTSSSQPAASAGPVATAEGGRDEPGDEDA